MLLLNRGHQVLFGQQIYQHLQPKVSSIINIENDITNRIRNINPKDPKSKYQPKNYNLIEDKGKKEKERVFS